MMLSHAHKIVCYRRDVLSEAALADIAKAKSDLEKAFDEKASEKELTKNKDALDKVLKKHGGKVYPVTFGNENVEMVIIAVVLAIGVRTYFFQPFKIPTNSMWPTYAGLNATVYPPSEPRPSLPARAFLGATQNITAAIFGNFNHYITAPNSGELMIPVIVQQTPVGIEGLRAHPWRTQSKEPMLGGKIPVLNKVETITSSYRLAVGGTAISVDLPGDFELEDVILQSWFPDFNWLDYGLTQVFINYKNQGKISRDPQNSGVFWIHTGIMLNEGDAVLDFNVNSGDMLFVDRFSYNFVRPKVGSPIVFRTDNIPGLRTEAIPGTGQYTVPDERYYIKRLVGVPGDELKVSNNTLIRNGEPIEGAKAFERNAKREEGYPGYRDVAWLADGNSISIPEDFYFAMGDNSPHSSDSRFWGYGKQDWVLTPAESEAGVPVNMVPEDDVIGRATFIFYPFSHRWGPAK